MKSLLESINIENRKQFSFQFSIDFCWVSRFGDRSYRERVFAVEYKDRLSWKIQKYYRKVYKFCQKRQEKSYLFSPFSFFYGGVEVIRPKGVARLSVR